MCADSEAASRAPRPAAARVLGSALLARAPTHSWSFINGLELGTSLAKYHPASERLPAPRHHARARGHCFRNSANLETRLRPWGFKTKPWTS